MRQLSEIDVILEYCLGALQEVLVKLQRSLWEDGSPVPKQIIGKAQSATRWVKDSTCKSCHKLISWFSTGLCPVPLAFERKYLLGSKYIASLDQADRDRVPQKLNITELRWNCKRCAWSLPSHGFTARGCWRSYWHSCHLFSSSFSFDRQKMFVWTWHQQDLLHSFCCRTLSTFRRSIRSVRSVDVCVATALFSQTHEFSEVQVRDWIFFVFSVSVLAKMLKDLYACVCVCQSFMALSASSLVPCSCKCWVCCWKETFYVTYCEEKKPARWQTSNSGCPPSFLFPTTSVRGAYPDFSRMNVLVVNTWQTITEQTGQTGKVIPTRMRCKGLSQGCFHKCTLQAWRVVNYGALFLHEQVGNSAKV